MMKHLFVAMFFCLTIAQRSITVWSAPTSAGGLLAGRITDDSGLPLPGVSITLESNAGRSVAIGSDELGFYRFDSLQPGDYRLRAEMVGFQSFEKTDLVVAPDSQVQLDIQLRLKRLDKTGSAAPQLEASLGAAELKEQTAGLNPAVGDAPLANMSVNVAEGFQKVTFIGESDPPDASGLSLPGASASMIAGSPDNYSTVMPFETFVISGSINFGMKPSPEGEGLSPFLNDERFQAVRERLGLEPQSRSGFFQSGGLETATGKSGKAKEGVAASRTVFKGLAAAAGSGTKSSRAIAKGKRPNRLQGQLFYTLRNSAFDARPYSLTGHEQLKPSYSNSRFGLTIGAPLQTSAANTKKARQMPSYLINYSGQRGRNSFNATSTVPSAEERLGNFAQSVLNSGAAVRLYDPLSGGNGGSRALFPGNRIPSNRMDPAALGLLQYLPLPNLPGRVQNFYFQQSLPSSNDQLMVRIFGRLNQHNGFNVSYTLNQAETNASSIFPTLQSATRLRNQSVELSDNYTLRKGVTNHLQLRFNRLRNLISNPFSYKTDILGQLDIRGLSPDPIDYGIPTIIFTNYGSLRLANPSLRRQQTWTLSDNFRMTGIKHSHHAGFEFRHIDNNLNTNENGRGTFNFSGYATSDFDLRGNPVPRTGLDFADFLLGLPQNTSRRYGGNNVYLTSGLYSAFYVDDWRVRPNLTLNLGIRYEYALPPIEKNDRLSNVDLPHDISGAALVLPGQIGPYTGQFPRSLVDPDRNNFAPRVGLAYRPSQKASFVVRAGYGIFYNLNIYDQVFPKLAGQPPFAVTQTLLTSPTQALTLRNGFPAEPSTKVHNSYAVDRYYRIGYVQSWNLNLQKDLRRGLVLEAAYMGSKGAKLDLLRAPNRAPAGSQISTEDRRLIGYADSFIFETSGAASIYHAMLLRVNRRFARGISLNGSYTWSKSLDSASSIGGGSLLVAQDDNNLRAERGLSAFDVRHRLNINYVLELPFGRGKKYLSQSSWGSRFFSNWTFTGWVALSSGSPFTARILGNASNNSGTGGNWSERADATGQPVALPRSERTVTHYFNTQAFALPAPGKFGNAGRNTIIGPGSLLLTLTVSRDIRIDENGKSLSLVCQANNLLNTPNFRGLATVVNSSNFGRITGTNPMRTLELTLRFRF